MAHVVAPHDVRAVGQAARVLVVGRAQQERRGVDGAGRHDDDVGRIRLCGTLTLDDHPLHVTARGTGLETRDVRARQQRHVGMLESGVDAEHLGVRFRIDETGMSVARLAANAAAGSGVPLVQHHAERNPRASRCIRCETCDGHPCLVYAKADAQVLCVDPALKHSNVTLLTRAYVSRLETSPSGRDVQRVIVEREGATEAYSADIVVVSAGAINSAALLLRSANDKHPRGLANGSDVVGRHYMGHVNSVLMALSKCPNPTVFQKTLALNDFYFGSKEWEFPMGHISFVGKLDGDTLRAGAPAIAPGWTLELMAKHSLDFWLTSEDL